MKKYISILMAACLLFGSVCIPAYADDLSELVDCDAILARPYPCDGALWDSDEFWEWAENTPFVNILPPPESTRSLPGSVNLQSSFPPPGDQGFYNSCVGWALAYAATSAAQKANRGWSGFTENHLFSPMYIYNQINGGLNVPVNCYDAASVMETKGICTMPYFNNVSYLMAPTALANASAKLYKVSSVDTVTDRNGMKQALAEGKGVAIIVKIYQDFMDLTNGNDVYDMVSGEYKGKHMICLIGYDNAKNAFKFINSWGTSWGLNGYGWIDYDFLDNVITTRNQGGTPIGLTVTVKPMSQDNYVLGDVTGDGLVKAADAQKVLRYSSGLETPTNSQYVLADVDGDGQVDAADAREILRYSSGLITEFSLYE